MSVVMPPQARFRISCWWVVGRRERRRR